MNFFLAAWHTLDTLITPHQFLHINNIFFVCVKWNERFMIWYSNVSFWKKNSSLLVACYYYYISNTFRGLVMSSWHYMYCHCHLHAQGLIIDRKQLSEKSRTVSLIWGPFRQLILPEKWSLCNIFQFKSDKIADSLSVIWAI